MIVIPREGVESSALPRHVNSHFSIVIPREGVESLNMSRASKNRNHHQLVIPREGVESFPKPPCEPKDYACVVIPREGVERLVMVYRKLA